MKTDYTIFRTDGTEERGSVDWPEDPGHERLVTLCEPIVGSSVLHLACVFHDGKPHDMITAAVTCFFDGQNSVQELSRNEAATTVYRSYDMSRNPRIDPESLPSISGNAVLFYRKVWL